VAYFTIMIWYLFMCVDNMFTKHWIAT